MKEAASVVVIGAGIAGCGVADHLTRMGWRDMVVVDGGPLFRTGGSTSHAPGGLFQTNPSKTMTEFAKYTAQRYKKSELDGEPCIHAVGSIEVAATTEPRKDLKRTLIRTRLQVRQRGRRDPGRPRHLWGDEPRYFHVPPRPLY